MFKAAILQSLHYPAEGPVEYRIRDRLAFSRVLGLGVEDWVPDAAAVWRFGERL
jgi:hypothetical protein